MLKIEKLYVNEYEEVSTKGRKLARLIDVENQMCCTGDLISGVYQVVEGVIEICDEEEGWDVILINNPRVVA